MSWIRKSPFGRSEDVGDFMVGIVAEEATRFGEPLSEDDKLLLRRELKKGELVPKEVESRLENLVLRIIEREVQTRETQQPRSFSGSIEWAGDQEYPYVVQLAEHVYCDHIHPGSVPSLTGWKRVKDVLTCIGCGLLIFLALMAIVGFLGFIGLLR